MEQNEYYKVPVEFIEEVFKSATEKKGRWNFPNEAWIEANACLDVVNYIKENFDKKNG